MSKSEELLRLERDLNESAELKEKLEEELKRIAQEREADSDGEAMVKAAEALGYHITAEELERAAAEMEALDDEELDSVAGGEDMTNRCLKDYECNVSWNNASIEGDKGRNVWCVTAWHCFAVTLHTESDRVTACWSNRYCIAVNKD